jgi:hypothetical protein
MATGPDPNRWQPRDPELPPEERLEDDALGNPRTTRLGLPSWAIVLIALVIVAVVLYLTAGRGV